MEEKLQTQNYVAAAPCFDQVSEFCWKPSKLVPSADIDWYEVAARVAFLPIHCAAAAAVAAEHELDLVVAAMAAVEPAERGAAVVDELFVATVEFVAWLCFAG